MSLDHYVPNFILKNFAGIDGKLWVLDKETGHTWSRTGGSEDRYKAFSEKEYNPPAVEKTLSMIEREAAQVIHEIVACVRKGGNPIVNDQEKGVLCAFLLIQSLRIPRVKLWVMGKKWKCAEDKELFWDMLRDLGEAVDLGFPKYLQVRSSCEEKMKPELNRLRKMAAMNIEIGKVNPNDYIDLFICDEPCIVKNTLDLVVMPIAKDLILQLCKASALPYRVHMMSKERISQFNVQSYQKARRFMAGTSENRLKSLHKT